MKMFLRRGMVLAGSGLLLGIVVSLATARVVSGLLFGIGAADPVTYLAVSVILLLVALCASSIPAYRAARLDPMTTLRDQ